MITDIEERSQVGPELRVEKLEPYWSEYFLYRDEASNLHRIIEEKLIEELDIARNQARPFLDSQQVISRVLTAVGSTANFHRQFTELFPEFKANQIIGMQLYALVASDEEVWVYTQIHHAGHMFPHASYFLPRR